eukprot:3612549-Prymnesium_polylepis.1
MAHIAHCLVASSASGSASSCSSASTTRRLRKACSLPSSCPAANTASAHATCSHARWLPAGLLRMATSALSPPAVRIVSWVVSRSARFAIAHAARACSAGWGGRRSRTRS